MQAEIICIGTELLLGEIVDTNAAFIASRLAEIGIDLYYKTTVGDNLPRITAELKRAWERSQVIITSGGLGPTQDDLTREGIAALFGEELIMDEKELEKLLALRPFFRSPMVASNRKQAMFPPSARPISNPEGTAPGLMVAKDGHYLFALPGVPIEMEKMLVREVLPVLRRISPAQPLFSRTLRMVGIGESNMSEIVADFIDNGRAPTVAPYAKRGECRLRLTARAADAAAAEGLIKPVEDEIRRRLGDYIYGIDEDTLEGVLGELLREQHLTIATAESCTGGLIGHRLTEVPGSSDYYYGGVVAYDNAVKTGLLGVAEATIAAHGAVSEETARAMAEGIRARLKTDLGLATTGIAGPGGGREEKPVGLVCLALATPDGTIARQQRYPWERSGNKEMAAQAALALAWEWASRKGGRKVAKS